MRIFFSTSFVQGCSSEKGCKENYVSMWNRKPSRTPLPKIPRSNSLSSWAGVLPVTVTAHSHLLLTREVFFSLTAPSWTCKMSDWSKSFKKQGLSQCLEDKSLLNGLQREENGGLEDFIDRLEGGWCCSLPPQYKTQNLDCHNAEFYHDG